MPFPTTAPPPRDRDPRRTRSGRRPGPRPLLVLRLLLWRARLPVAALLVGCACALVVEAVRPTPPATAPVLVVGHDVAAGERLTSRDVRLVRVPVDLVPTGSVRSVDDLPDATLAVPAPPGLPVVAGLFTPTSVHGPPGTVVVPVRFADPDVAAMLTPGTVVDVLASGDGLGGDEGAGRVVARRALVLAGPGDGAVDGGTTDPLGGGLLGGRVDEAPPLVLLAVSAEESVTLAGSSGISAVFVE